MLEKWGHPIIDAGAFVGYHLGATKGSAIFFTVSESGMWPYTYGIELTLEGELGLKS